VILRVIHNCQNYSDSPSSLPTKYPPIEEDEMKGFWFGSLEGRYQGRYLGLGRKIILDLEVGLKV
jgi:hypothetical protein